MRIVKRIYYYKVVSFSDLVAVLCAIATLLHEQHLSFRGFLTTVQSDKGSYISHNHHTVSQDSSESKDRRILSTPHSQSRPPSYLRTQAPHYLQAWVFSRNSEILKVVLKCPEIYAYPGLCRCPEIFEHTCKWCMHQCTCKSLTEWVDKHLSASGSGRLYPCEPQTQLWTLKTEGHTRTVTLLKIRNKQNTYLFSSNYSGKSAIMVI